MWPAVNASGGSTVAAWLLGKGEAPTAEVLRSTGLAAHAYTVLPVHHTLRPLLRADYVAFLGRHQKIKRELLALCTAWRKADIDVLLFKGFHLAEFVYAVPGARFHGDVDVLLRPAQLERAAAIARALGWYLARPASAGLHNAFTLVSASGATMLEAHQSALHINLPWCRTQDRITDALWRDSRAREWEGVEIREPSPVDALLAGLILQRCWGSDGWRLKPSDFIDAQRIVMRGQIRRDDLLARARDLRCERTLALFLTRCDPWSDRLDLTPPDSIRQRRWNQLAFAERGLLGRPELLAAALLYGWPKIWLALVFVTTVLRVRRALRQHTDLRALLQSLTPGKARRFSRRPREHIVSGINWAIRLVGTGGYGSCLVRSLAVYRALRQRGWPAEFVSGVRRETGNIVGHAWVELNGSALWELEESSGSARYEQNFRFPGSGVHERQAGSQINRHSAQHQAVQLQRAQQL